MLILNLSLFIPSFLGALGQEILHWYNLSKSLGNNVKLFDSKSYWSITIISILFFGITATYLIDFIKIDGISKETKLFLFGFFYPIIIKYLLKNATKLFSTGSTIPMVKATENGNTLKIFKTTSYLTNY